jgi:hypothetical protein
MKRTLAMIIVILTIVSLPISAMALDLPYTLKGKVVSIDPLTRTFTMQTYDPLLPSAIGKAKEYTFTLGELASVLMCDQNRTFEDVKVGDKVKVDYHDDNGNLVADIIILTAPIIACLE